MGHSRTTPGTIRAAVARQRMRTTMVPPPTPCRGVPCGRPRCSPVIAAQAAIHPAHPCILMQTIIGLPPPSRP